MSESEDRLHRLESEIERKLTERFAGLRDEFDRLRLESDRRWAGFLSRFDQDFTGLVPPELVQAPEPAPSSAPDRPDGAGLLSIEVARSLDDAGNQVEALHRFLDLCRRHASRAALLITKAGGFAVWKATGFSDNGGNDEATRRVTLPMDGGPLTKVIEGTPYRLGADNDLSTRLGAGDVAAAVLVPMVVKEKVSGAVYADATRADAARFDAESIAFLTFLAGLFVDRLAGRKLKPAPPLRDLQEVGAAEAPAAPAAAGRPTPEAFALPSEPAAAPRPSQRDSFGTKILSFDAGAGPEPAAPPPPPPPPARPAPPPPEPMRREAEPEPEPEPELSSAPEPSLAYDFDEPVQRPKAPPPSPPPPPAAAAAPTAPAPPPAAPAPAAPKSEPAAAGSAAAAAAPFRPTAGARRLAGPLAPADSGDERKEEARRFAKLLVSEIKLYNEKAVLDGRQQGNLYERLKEDIDRSRQMYDERIPEDVRASSNFFYEELVRILADGRADALGI
jgi:hypothetical protein